MRNTIKLCLLVVVICLSQFSVKSQCAYNNTLWGDLTPPGVGLTASTTVAWAGDYYTVNVCNGAQYTFTTCATAGTYDTELTLYNATGTTVLGYSDDVGGACGNQSTITWTATFSGTVHILLDQWPCSDGTTNTTIEVTQNTACSGGGGGGSCTDNDDCLTPAVITWTTGVQTCLTDCNTGALPGPDFTGLNCQDFPFSTVWYSVTTGPSSATLDISLTSAAMANPYFAVFTTADCLNYTTFNCTQGSGGSASATVNVSVNTTYLIAISDALAATGNFDLCITVENDNSACNTNQSLVVSSTSMGSPLNGPYLPGEQVSFCYTITDYQEFNCNYLQGVVPTFGDCWDPASFNAQGMPITITNPLDVNGIIQPCAPGPPCAWSACAGTPAGAWSWFPAGSVNYNNLGGTGSLPDGTPLGAGWYFLSSYNPLTGACTGDPTDPDNSYGDGNFPNCGVNTFDYTLCFTLIARGSAGCTSGNTDCSVSIKTFADGEIGVWNNVGCTADISSSAGTTLCCTAAPTVTTPVNYCQGSAASPLSATGTSLLWYTTATGGVGSAVAPTPSTATVGSTNYYVSQTVGGCESPRAIITVNVFAPANAGTNGSITVCSNGASVNLFSSLGGSPAATGSWTGPSALGGGNLGTYNPVTMAPGVYTYTVTGTSPCPNATATVTVTETTAPSATISYGSPFCTSSGVQNVTLTGTAGGTFTAAPAGLSINAGTGAITPSTSTAGTYTVTYTVPAGGGCAAFSTTASVTITTAPSATISYAGPFCTTAGVQNVTLTGTGGGTYTVAPAGLSINAATGQITPSSSTAGTYTVTYTIAASGGCPVFTTTASVTITAAPTATISYGGPFCTTAGVQNVTQTGTAGGNYTATPAGLSINAATGQITPSTSSAGTYTVTYTIAASGGCAAFSTTASVTITAAPTATISYAGPFCTTAGVQNVTQTGTAGGTYTSAPAGLTLNAATGQITPSTSTAGTYTVTYTIAASGGCAVFTTTANVTITAAPTATISYSGSPFCTSATPVSVTQTGTAGGTYTSAPAGLTINAATGQITPATSTAGTYTITYTIAASGGCAAFTTTASVTITQAPTATISYAGSPVCISAPGTITVTQTGTAGGTYTAAPAGLSINAANGTITPSTSTAGTYTVTYTIAASGGCAVFTTTASVTINPLDNASFTYGSATYCQTGTDPTPSITGLAGGTFTSAPAGLSINAATGTIDLSASALNTYTITYTTSGSCPNTSSVNITITSAPAAGFSYTGTPYCQSGTDPLPTFVVGASAGTFSATPAGLVFVNVNTGEVDLSASTPGTYTVTNDIAASGGCAPATASNTITINPAPTATISYAGSPYCTSLATAQAVTFSGTTGGTFSSAPGGLSINPATGAITPSASAAGTYTVTYTIPAAAGCATFTTTASVTITTAPTATISYAGPFCTTAGLQSVTQTGTAGGTYTSAPAGLTINAATGQITPSTSTAGTYTVTYTIAASGGCAVFTTTASVTITAAPTATISYAGTPFCTSLATPQAVTLTGSTGGTYTASPAGLSINAATGEITPSTSTAGTYTVTYTIAASGGCAAFSTTFNVTITTAPTATISYAGPFCNSVATAQNVTLSGTSGGTFTSSPAGLSINGSTGAVTPSTSTAGTYTVTYTIAASGGCAIFTTTATVVINANPSFSIAGSTNPTSCGGTDGTITLTGLNASTNYTISYNDGALVNLGSVSTDGSGNYVITGLDAGNYGSFTVTNASGCSLVVTGPVTLTDPSAPTGTVSAVVVNPSTCGGTDGSITLTGLNPSSTYNISYNDGTGTVTLTGVVTDASGNYVITGLGAGTYTSFGLTLAGCSGTATGSATLTDPSAPTFTVGGVVNPTSCGGTDGSITISGLNPSTSYDITYNNGSTVNLGTVTTDASGNYVISGLGAGSYGTFTVTFAACTGTDLTTLTLVDPSAPVFTVTLTSNPTSCGGSDGSITISGLNASTAYDITYSNGSTVNLGTVTTDASGNYVITGLSAGSYTTFSVTLAGCNGIDNSVITLTDPGAPVFGVALLTNPTTCGGTDGSIIIAGLNPSTSYDITYSDGTSTINLGTVTTDGFGTYTITGLGAGSYTTFTVTLAGCTGTDVSVITLTDPATPTFTVSTSVNPTACGVGDGSITITGLNPSSTYDITYNDGTGTVTLAGVTTDASGNYIITGLPAGSYTTFTVTASGCTATDAATTVTLTDPGAPSGFTISSVNPTCGGADGSITISGLTPSTTYDITYNDGTGTITLTGITTDASGNYIITGLGAGTYSSFNITILGCTATPSDIIVLTTPTPQSANAGPDQTVCATSTTLAANAVISGTGTWSVLGGTGTFSNANSETSGVTGLSTGANSFVWTIVNGTCPVTSDTVIINAEQPLATAAAGPDQLICDTVTSVTISANGSGIWVITSGTGTLANALDSITTLSAFTSPVTVTWTISGTGICPSTSDDVVVTTEVCDTTTFQVPTGFTPDGDGTNDVWDIPGLNSKYPESKVEIFTRWGAKIFTSDTGYATPWDGTYNNNVMPLGAYYFVIYFNDGVTDPMKGTVTIVK